MGEITNEIKEMRLREMVGKEEDLTGCVALYLDLFEDTDVMHANAVEDEIREMRRNGDEDGKEQARRLTNMLDDNPGVTYFDYYKEEPITFGWLRERLAMGPKETTYWSVPVVYEMYGSVSVAAKSAEEAYDKVKNHPEEFDLPDESFYVDDSFRVADDDRENAIGTIKMLSCSDEHGQAEEGAASGRHTGLTVKATVTFQKWEGDIARFNGEAEFDACDALDSMDDDEIAQIERNDPYALDHVYLRAVSFGQIHDYDGPFEVELDEDNLSDYLEARREGR